MTGHAEALSVLIVLERVRQRRQATAGPNPTAHQRGKGTTAPTTSDAAEHSKWSDVSGLEIGHRYRRHDEVGNLPSVGWFPATLHLAIWSRSQSPIPRHSRREVSGVAFQPVETPEGAASNEEVKGGTPTVL